ncbi:MAG TPA: GGDEF domain-containing protein, partial [Mycobacterium sp.]
MTAAGQNHYYWLTSLLAARGLQTRTCRVIAALNALLGVVPVLLMLSPAGPHGPVRQAIAIAIGVFAIGVGAIWLRHAWPSQRFSAVSVSLGAIPMSAA